MNTELKKKKFLSFGPKVSIGWRLEDPEKDQKKGEINPLIF